MLMLLVKELAQYGGVGSVWFGLNGKTTVQSLEKATLYMERCRICVTEEELVRVTSWFNFQENT